MENSKKENLPLDHGSIMYTMTCTRPDVSFALSMDSRAVRVYALEASMEDYKDEEFQLVILELFHNSTRHPLKYSVIMKSALALTKEPKDHGKSKHIDRKYHFVRSKVAEGHVIVKDIRSEDNPADPFTKALAKSKHDEHAWSIGLKDKIKF
ncbi:hypothetical protein Tco_0835083 [Tanacetum coccineum]